MILGIDNGTRTFGWAVVDSRAFVRDLGALVQEVDNEVDKSTDSSRRVSNQSDILVALRTVTAIVHEAGSYSPHRFKMSVGLAMSIGAVIGVARAFDIPLYELPPKRWQRAIRGKPGKVDYADVYRRVEERARMRSEVSVALDRIKHDHRNHALDAAGIALCHAIDPTLATRVR